MVGDPRVLLDATAVPVERGGVGRYVEQLVREFAAGCYPVTVLCQRRDSRVFADLGPGLRVVSIDERLTSRPARLAWEQTALPRIVSRLGVDVLHSPHYTMPLAASVPTVVTLHDATFFSDRALHLGVKGRFFRTWTRVSLRRAAVCVVPSKATADEVRRWTGASGDNLVVAYHGVAADVFHPPSAGQLEAFRSRLSLEDRRWIAFLGTLEPRKNVPALIRGYVQTFHGRQDPPVLVLTGSDGWDDGVGPAIAAVPDDLTVIRTGHLPLDLLPALLGGAELVCYPSLGEGFGLPVLEAMACGAAVLTTRRLSLPEVGGDAVAYSGVSAAEIADGLARLDADSTLRDRLSTAATERAAGFSWAACAQAHLEAYRRAARART